GREGGAAVADFLAPLPQCKRTGDAAFELDGRVFLHARQLARRRGLVGSLTVFDGRVLTVEPGHLGEGRKLGAVELDDEVEVGIRIAILSGSRHLHLLYGWLRLPMR